MNGHLKTTEPATAGTHCTIGLALVACVAAVFYVGSNRYSIRCWQVGAPGSPFQSLGAGSQFRNAARIPDFQ